MSLTDQIAAAGAIFTGVAAVVALVAFIYTWHQYQNDQRQQRTAQTREVLQAIIADCSRFLRPLAEEYPYPILHTATDISKEFCTRMGEHPQGEIVLRLLHNEKLLRSICVEGWINSTQIFRMLSIAEELERKASSHYLRGKLLLICDASFFLAGLVAQVCSPDSFFAMLRGLHDDLEGQLLAPRLVGRAEPFPSSASRFSAFVCALRPLLEPCETLLQVRPSLGHFRILNRRFCKTVIGIQSKWSLDASLMTFSCAGQR